MRVVRSNGPILYGVSSGCVSPWLCSGASAATFESSSAAQQRQSFRSHPGMLRSSAGKDTLDRGARVRERPEHCTSGFDVEATAYGPHMINCTWHVPQSRAFAGAEGLTGRLLGCGDGFGLLQRLTVGDCHR